jgi:hypothetical protein
MCHSRIRKKTFYLQYNAHHKTKMVETPNQPIKTKNLKKNYNYPLKSEKDPSISMEATQRNWITTEFKILEHETENALI